MFTSMAEGLYASLRTIAQYEEDDDLKFGFSTSRLGVQGERILHDDWAGLYHFEWDIDNDERGESNLNVDIRSRLAYIGLKKGDYGTLRMGRMWSAEYENVLVFNHISNSGAARFLPNGYGHRGGVIRYDSPNRNGFQFTGQTRLEGSIFDIRDSAGSVKVANNTAATDKDDGNHFDQFVLVGNYFSGGFAGGAFYGLHMGVENIPGWLRTKRAKAADVNAFIQANAADIGTRTVSFGSDAADENESMFGAALAYGRDAWRLGYYYYVADSAFCELAGAQAGANGYAISESCDAGAYELTTHSFSAQWTQGRWVFRTVYETQEGAPPYSFVRPAAKGAAIEESQLVLETQYTLDAENGAIAWLSYVNDDVHETNPIFAEGNKIFLGYRVDF